VVPAFVVLRLRSFGFTESRAAEMSNRVAPGGKSTLVLGGDDDCALLQEASNETSIETPNPAPRFPQAVGGNSTICLGGNGTDHTLTLTASHRAPAGGASTIILGGAPPAEAHSAATSDRVPAGGVASVILGTDLPAEAFKKPAVAEFDTPMAASRFSQEPGGTASIILGGGTVPTVQEEQIRGPPGGASTVLLGTEDTGAILCQRQDERVAHVETHEPITRFLQAPGGTSSFSLAGDGEVQHQVDASRGPVGGAATIVLGMDDTKEILERLQQERSTQVCTPEAVPRFQQGPGGTASICLGTYGLPGDHNVVADATRGPVGGPGHIVLGGDDNREVFKQLQELREAPVNTPSAVPRFSQAPGGTASIKLEPSEMQADDAPAMRGPVGGETTICLATEDVLAEGSDQQSADARGPVGGPSTIVLGGDDSHAEYMARQMERAVAIETPAAARRHQQAPGGNSTVCLDTSTKPNDIMKVAKRGAGGGAATLVLGCDNFQEILNQRQQQREVCIETPASQPRVSQAPGGTSSISLECKDGIALEQRRTRGPVGGPSAVILGVDDTREMFRQHEAELRQPLETPAAAARFQQAPGGNSSVFLGEGVVDGGVAVRGPVGGASAVVLGTDSIQDVFRLRQTQQEQVVETPEAALRFQQAPGGNTTIHISDEPVHSDEAAQVVARGPVGGEATVVLGIDDSKEIFNQHAEKKQTEMETSDAAARFPQAPGGTSTIILGGGNYPKMEQSLRQSPGGATTLVLGGDYPHEVAARNVAAVSPSAAVPFSAVTGTDERGSKRKEVVTMPFQRVRHAPGGMSSICLGDEDGTNHVRVSSNQYANGSNQNEGNVLTDRSTTRVHCAPGGASSICLGDETAKATKILTEQVSANRFANGANQNCGNTITDRPTTRLHFAPGGASTICLGSDDPDIPATAKANMASNKLSAVVTNENVSTENVADNQDAKDPVKGDTLVHCKQAPGGVATVVLG